MTRNTLLKITALGAIICMIVISYNCKKQPAASFYDGQYPTAVGQIIENKCATPGCHTTEAAGSAANLDLSTWTKAFKGSAHGAMIIPYNAAQSWIYYYINTNPQIAPALTPTMPLNQLPLTASEEQTLVDWINQGAPDANGNIAFSDPNSSKIYVTNQGCDNVTVFDANTKLASRFINVGNPSGADADVSPHQVKVSPDGKYWYVVFIEGSDIQKYDAATDQLIGNINIGSNGGSGTWTSISILPDGNHAFVASWQSNGELVYVDLKAMKSERQFSGLIYPHAINRYRKTLYVTAQYGNVIYKYSNTDSLANAKFPPQPKELVLAPGEYPNFNSELDPHEIAFTPDSSEYLVTCENSNEVRVFKTSNDSLLAVIPVGKFPQEMAVSKTSPYVYVTCMYDPSTAPSTEGSVCILNYKTNTFVKKIQDGLWQPHGITLDENNKVAYVLSQNLTANGPAPHHSSVCGGRNGYSMLIDMSTLNFVPNSKRELSADTYADAYRP